MADVVARQNVGAARHTLVDLRTSVLFLAKPFLLVLRRQDEKGILGPQCAA